MMKTIGTKVCLAIILTNLLIGNGILFFGGKSSFGESVNYPLMAGMSIACIVFYVLFFKYSNFEIYGRLKLIFLSVLSCVIIIFTGNFFALLIEEPVNEVLENIPAALFMGMMGNILMFPISLVLGLTNFGIITYFTKK